MATATLTSKGQITIPAVVRDSLHISAGDRLEFIQTGEGRFEIIAASKDVSNLKGMIQTTKKVTIEDMNAAVKQRVNNK
ncbi:MAG: AbrB/MazE/SpoVT family DNA-binding domain-containing protein [Pseudomonadota bacterium]